MLIERVKLELQPQEVEFGEKNYLLKSVALQCGVQYITQRHKSDLLSQIP